MSPAKRSRALLLATVFGPVLATACAVDGDGDGVKSSYDCDDGDPASFPYAEETCDGKDNDCDGVVDNAYATGAQRYFYDGDRDGHGVPEITWDGCAEPGPAWVSTGDDCDDAAASTFPGAEEQCDGTDNNCDGVIDEGSVTLYVDADGDGHGDALTTTTSACTRLDGHVANGDDCDDGDAQRHPGAAEACDRLDQDCDQVVDEGPRVLYADFDADGYGTGADAVATACETLDGYSAVPGDCDDADGGVNPGATEICLDGVDQDCSGADRTTCTLDDEVGIVDDSGSPVAFGAALALPGDLDGDGESDVVVGAPTPLGAGTGAAYVFRGPVTASQTTSAALAAIVGDGTFHGMGSGVFGLGDVNGDALDDFAVGQPGPTTGAGSDGGLYLYSVTGSASLGTEHAFASLRTGEAGDRLGSAAAADDLTGFGLVDLLVGAPDSDGDGGVDSGRAHMLYGAFAPYEGDLTPTYTLDGLEPGHAFGHAVAVGDLDGDGASDAAISAPGGAKGRGVVYLYQGGSSASLPASADDAMATVTLEAGTVSLAVGDATNDGTGDLAIGQADAGKGGVAWVFSGPSGPVDAAEAVATVEGTVAGAGLGGAVAVGWLEPGSPTLAVGAGAVGDVHLFGPTDLTGTISQADGYGVLSDRASSEAGAALAVGSIGTLDSLVVGAPAGGLGGGAAWIWQLP